MDNKTINEAVENISLIKGIIDRTSKSFAAFSRIFIYWGILFIFNSVIQAFMLANQDKMLDISIRYPVINYVFPVGFIALIAALIYRNVSKKLPLVGLEKQLIILWLLILIMNIIPQRIIIDTSQAAQNMSTVVVHTNTFSVMLFSLAVGLIATSMFAGYRQLKYTGIVFIVLSLTYAFFNIPVFTEEIIWLLQSISLPFTFLYTGLFLKSRQARGE
ncbi:MAG: hypothetical protein GX660_18680 [Clostridiaceae bacterium]|nr:hypothetical protein [Clostridiaceae bacterium]